MQRLKLELERLDGSVSEDAACYLEPHKMALTKLGSVGEENEEEMEEEGEGGGGGGEPPHVTREDIHTLQQELDDLQQQFDKAVMKKYSLNQMCQQLSEKLKSSKHLLERSGHT